MKIAFLAMLRLNIPVVPFSFLLLVCLFWPTRPGRNEIRRKAEHHQVVEKKKEGEGGKEDVVNYCIPSQEIAFKEKSMEASWGEIREGKRKRKKGKGKRTRKRGRKIRSKKGISKREGEGGKGRGD